MIKVSLIAVAFTVGTLSLKAQFTDSNPLQLSPHHATASVANLDKESAWYEQVLGFQEVSRSSNSPDFQVRHLALGDYRIDLVWQKGSSRPAQAGALRQGWFHVVFKTPIIEADLHRLQALGTDVKADRNTQHAITRLILHDAEGNELEIAPQAP
jgi:catechol 2,3-dioxygenase-like lactoylglutathione lyase family enzyme